MYNRKASVILLNIIELFERFSYYGIRALIILYITAPDGLAMNNESALGYFSTFTLLLALVAVPFGLLSDLVLKQKNAVIIGGTFALFGSLLLLSNQVAIIGAGAIMLLIGTGFVRSNLIVLLGRLFSKKDQNRDLAFILRHIAINFGSFLGALLIGYTGEVIGYTYGFGLAALAILVYLVLFLIIKKKLELNEEIFVDDVSTHSTLLDQEQPLIAKRNPFYSTLLIILLSLIFFETFSAALSFFRDAFNQVSWLFFSNQEPPVWLVDTLYFSCSIVIAIILLFIGYKKSVLSSWQKMTGAFFGIALASLIIFGSEYLTGIPPQISIITVGILLSAIEIVMAAVSLSYITRLSDTKYASTTIGVFFLFNYLGAEGVTYLENNFSLNISLIHYFCLALIIGIVLVLFRKEWSILSGGLR